jgi:hypothetical protein
MSSCAKGVKLMDCFGLEVSVCKLDSAGNDVRFVSIAASLAFQFRVAIEAQTPSFESVDR